MKRKRLLLFLGMAMLFVGLAYSQMPQQVTVPQIPFESVPNYFKLPAGMYFGDLPAVAVNSKGHVFVLSRSNISGPAFAPMAAQVLEFDQNGNYVREIGHGMYSFSYPHGIRIDKNDDIWVADKVSNAVTEFHPDGTFAAVYGRRPESGDPPGQGPINDKVGYTPPTDSDFHGPADVAWDSQGNLYVDDGYGNNRIAVFDKNGEWSRSFGVKGSRSGVDNLNNPHNIGIDNQDHLWIADRGNGRTVEYDLKNNFAFMREIKFNNIAYAPGIHAWTGNTPVFGQIGGGSQGIGAPWGLCITPGPNQNVYIGDAFPGRIYKLTMDGKVLGTLGRAGRQLGQFGWVHGLACPNENTLYAADENNFRVQKLLLHPDKTQESRASN